MRLAAFDFALALLVVLAGESRAVTAFGPNPPGLNRSGSEGTKFIGSEKNSPSPKKSKTAAGGTGAVVNKSGAKGATVAASKGGRVFLTRPQANRPAPGGDPRKKEKSAGARPQPRTKAAAKAEDPDRKPPPNARGTARDTVESPAPVPAADASPRIEFNRPREAAGIAPPAMPAEPGAHALPGADPPAARAVDPTPLAHPVPLGSGAGGAPAPEAPGRLPGRAVATNREEILPWYYALAALLFFLIGALWIRGMEKKPWLAYTEDWVDGFLWRWEWKKTEVKNLRGFCPTCRTEVVFRPIATAKNAPPDSQAVGTWAFCPCCKEATGLEMSDVSRAVAMTLARKRNSGEYRETVAVAKRKAGIPTERAVRIKVVDGRVV